MKAVALLRKPSSLNQTEARYWDKLVLDPSIHAFGAHRLVFLLGPDCRYTPDFDVIRTDGSIELHEVKGPFIRTGDDGMVKLRMAAATFPWYRWFRAQEGRDKHWDLREVSA